MIRISRGKVKVIADIDLFHWRQVQTLGKAHILIHKIYLGAFTQEHLLWLSLRVLRNDAINIFIWKLRSKICSQYLWPFYYFFFLKFSTSFLQAVTSWCLWEVSNPVSKFSKEESLQHVISVDRLTFEILQNFNRNCLHSTHTSW